MNSLDHPPTRLVLDSVLLAGALLLGFVSGQFVVSKGAEHIVAKIRTHRSSPVLSRPAKAIQASGEPSLLSPAPTPPTSFRSSVIGEDSERVAEDSRKTVAPAPRPPSPNVEALRPGNLVTPPTQPAQSQDLPMLRIAVLQVLSGVAAVLIGFVMVATILYVLRRRWGIRFRLEMAHAPFPTDFERFPLGQSKAVAAKGSPPNPGLGSKYEHDRRQRAETESEMLRHLCQQNLLLHQAIRQQAAAA